MSKVEIGPPASREEIDGFIVETHQFVLGAWAKQELRKSPLAEASTIYEWTMEPRPGCKLTVTSPYEPMYLEPEATFKDYHQEDYNCPLPLRLDLPKGRRGLFNMIVNREKTKILDRQPRDIETLSLPGLLKLLDVVDAEEAYSYIAAQAKSLKQPTKVSRTVRMRKPMDNRWPDIVVSDETLAGSPGHVGVSIDYYYQPIEIGRRPAQLMFAGSTDPQLAPKYLNTFPQLDQNRLTKTGILELQEMVEESIDGMYGHGCYHYDREVGGPFFSLRQEFFGINGEPSIAAREGYQYAHEFPGVHDC